METLEKCLNDRKHIKWNNNYCLGIQIIDAEHKRLFNILNKAIDAKEHSDNKEELMEALEEMTKYALVHFKTEEGYMREFNYPEYGNHKKEHSSFFDKTIAYFERVVSSDYHLANELIEYLKQWLVNHIQVSDRQFIDCFKTNGL